MQMSKYLQISLTDWPYFLNSSAAIRYMLLSFDGIKMNSTACGKFRRAVLLGKGNEKMAY